LKARIARRALIGAGLYLAWLGLSLPWQTWRAATDSADGSTSGFAESRPFWIVLAVATVLAVVALWRHTRWAFTALGIAALGLVALVVREIGASRAADSAFVSVAPGAGAVLSLAGAVALLAAVVVAPRPRGLQRAGSLAAIAVVAGLAVAWPQDHGRPDEGAIADALDDSGRAMAFEGDTLYRLDGAVAVAEPDGDHEYSGVTLWDFDWSADDELDASGRDIAFGRGALFASLGGLDRLISIAPDGSRSMLVARPPDPKRHEPPIPDGETQIVEHYSAGPLAAAPDGSVYMLHDGGVARWRNGRLETVARRARFAGPRDIAVDAGGAVYVADTGNGRVRRIDPEGAIETVVGTAAAPGCVGRGLDDPLALDIRRCTGVRALAVDRDGNLYLALRGVAMIVGVTPDGRLSVVAGTGPMGWGDGDGRAVQARLGVVDALTVGPDGDLYVSESAPIERVRRIAAPAGLLGAPRAEPESPEPAPACAEIAALMEATVNVRDAQALERGLNALAAAAPEEIRDDVDEITAGATAQQEAFTGIRFAMKPGEFAVSLGDYAEQKCGLVGGFDVAVEDANAFCVAYERYLDRRDLAEGGEEPPEALVDAVGAAPPFLAATGRDALLRLESAAGRALPASEAAQLVDGLRALDTAAFSMCALG